jgi:hypothetical protein
MINPKLSLNWAAGQTQPLVNVARTGVATYIDNSGAVQLASDNTQRVDYRYGQVGLLVEETRTNEILNSVFANAASPSTAPTSWSFVFSTGTFASVSAGTYAGGNKLLFECTDQRRVLGQTVNLNANTVYSISGFIEIVEGTPSSFDNHLNLNGTGFTPGTRFLNNVPVSNDPVPPGKYLFSRRFIVGASATSATFRFGLGAGGNGTGKIWIEMPQIEVGDLATSYIPTTTTAVTRNADVATITGTNFSSFWRATRGGVLVRALPSTVSGTRPLVQFDDNTADNIIALRGNTTNPELYIKATTDQATIDAGTIAANTAYRLAGTWATDDCAANLNGGVPVLDTSATIPTVTQMRLGSDGTNYLNGHLQSIEYYDERILNSNLQVVSSPAGYRSIIGPVLRDSIIS